jgi:hypothetical protein
MGGPLAFISSYDQIIFCACVGVYVCVCVCVCFCVGGGVGVLLMHDQSRLAYTVVKQHTQTHTQTHTHTHTHTHTTCCNNNRYLTTCEKGGETAILSSKSGGTVAAVAPVRGRLLVFPHECWHEGRETVSLPKRLLRGELR